VVEECGLGFLLAFGLTQLRQWNPPRRVAVRRFGDSRLV
jgi:hypothetical protein